MKSGRSEWMSLRRNFGRLRTWEAIDWGGIRLVVIQCDWVKYPNTKRTLLSAIEYSFKTQITQNVTTFQLDRKYRCRLTHGTKLGHHWPPNIWSLTPGFLTSTLCLLRLHSVSTIYAIIVRDGQKGAIYNDCVNLDIIISFSFTLNILQQKPQCWLNASIRLQLANQHIWAHPCVSRVERLSNQTKCPIRLRAPQFATSINPT